MGLLDPPRAIQRSGESWDEFRARSRSREFGRFDPGLGPAQFTDFAEEFRPRLKEQMAPSTPVNTDAQRAATAAVNRALAPEPIFRNFPSDQAPAAPMFASLNDNGMAPPAVMPPLNTAQRWQRGGDAILGGDPSGARFMMNRYGYGYSRPAGAQSGVSSLLGQLGTRNDLPY